jgi:NhaP-type Na+/H+ or K+/H+ antiporter
MREILKAALSVMAIVVLAGCSHAPTFNILGSFFPSWLICLIVGICLAALVSWVLARLQKEKLIAWPVLTYPCLAAFFSFVLWLIFFN